MAPLKLLILLHLLVTICRSQFATISTNLSASTFELSSSTGTNFYLPGSLKNGTAPIVAYYSDRVFIIDAINKQIVYSNTEDSVLEWSAASLSTDLWPAESATLCRTAKCYTQIDQTLYIIYDDTNTILKYDLNGRAWEGLSDPISFEYAGHWSLANNGTHIFGVGQEANILILDVTELTTAHWSTPYISNGEISTIAMDDSLTSLYIFNKYAALLYKPSDDTLTTLYNREETMGLNTTKSPIIASNSYNDLIMIKGDEYMYPFSSKTNKFLHCRAPNTANAALGSLHFIDQNLFEFGGITDASYASLSSDNEEIVALKNITYIETRTINANRLRLNDWYFPNVAIGINYTGSFVEGYTDGHIGINLTSDEFDLRLTAIYFSPDTDPECQVCYEGQQCAGDDPCITQGLNVNNLLDDSNHVFDAYSTVYSIEATIHEPAVGISSDNSRFVCDSFLIYPVYIVLNISLYADDVFYLNVDYAYECNGCSVDSFADSSLYPFSSNIVLKSTALGIDNEITLSIENGQSCVIKEGNEVFGCDNYTLSHVSEIYFNGDYIIELNSTDTFLESDSVSLQLSESETRCKTGTGYNADLKSCAICPEGTFSLRPTLSACIECGGVEGVLCGGGSSITVDYRYWVSGYRPSTEEYVTLYEMNNATGDEMDILIAHICGFGQCCMELDGCDYMTMYDEGTLCAANRDLTSAMCTGCADGYHDLLSTNECGYVSFVLYVCILAHFNSDYVISECTNYENMWYLLGTFSIAFVLTFYLAFCDAKPLDIMIDKAKNRHSKDTDSERDSEDEYSSSEYEEDSDADDNDGNHTSKAHRVKKKSRAQIKREAQKQMKIEYSYFVADSYIANSALIFQVFVYYFQGYSEILSTSGSRAYLAPIVNMFNFNFGNDGISGTDNNGYCAIPNTNALSEIFISLIFPGFMFFSLLLIYSFCSRGCGDSYYTKPYVAISFYRIYIICVGLVFRVLMQLTTCTRFVNKDSWQDEKWEQFYFESACFGVPWFVSLAFMIILVIYFVQIYIKLWQQSNEERYALDNQYTKLVQAYNNKHWYWEAVITSRRFIITIFVTLSFIGGGYSNLVLVLLLIFYLIAHLTIYPFKHKRNNRIETFCILSILIGFIGVNFSDIANSLFLSLFLGVVIFLPILLAIYYIFKLCINCKQYYDGNEEYFINSKSARDQQDKLSLMKKRIYNQRKSMRALEINLDGYGGNAGNKSTGTDVNEETVGYGIEMGTMVQNGYNEATNGQDEDSSSCGLDDN